MLKAFLSFDSFIYPKIVKVIYWIGLVGIVLVTIIGAVGALFAGSNPEVAATGYNSGLAFLGTLIFGLVGLVIWRISVELWLVVFSIHDMLKEIRDNTKKS